MPNRPISIQLSASDLAPAAAPAANFAAVAGGTNSFDGAARSYINLLFEAPPTSGFEAASQALSGSAPDLRFAGLTEQTLTNTVTAEYEQRYKGVPIYGLPVGVEMQRDTSFMGFGGAIAAPTNINPIATLSPSAALAVVQAIAGLKAFKPLPDMNAPRLMLRYDDGRQEWNLVYVFESVPIHDDAAESSPGPHILEGGDADASSRFMNVFRVFVDAHTGLEVARVPIRKTVGVACTYTDPVTQQVLNFDADENPVGTFTLFDPVRKIRTKSLGLSDLNCGPTQLPGSEITVVPAAGAAPAFTNRAAIIAHCNAVNVYDFFKSIFKRNSINGNGMEIVSVVDCLDYRHNGFFCTAADPAKREWKNAAWIRDNRPTATAALRAGLMVYGQTTWPDGNLHSYAEALDVVGHELTHGITDYTCDLEYQTESGALNESYSDIIGTAIANAATNNVATWDWELGEQLSPTGSPTRNIKDPLMGKPNFSFAFRNQPDHMDDFIRLSAGEDPHPRTNDNGYVHYNSGIHNKAAYNLFTSGKFTWQEVAQMYYLTLTTPGRLSRTASFRDSMNGMIASCKVLFQGLTQPQIDDRVAAITNAFSAVGIV